MPAKCCGWRRLQITRRKRGQPRAIRGSHLGALASRLHYQLCKLPNWIMKKSVNAILMVTLLTACCLAQTTTLKVLPWNNHSAALSLTFDDSRAVHLDLVV